MYFAPALLRKAIGRSQFRYDKLLTAVTEIEAILNSRPLSYVSADDVEEPLTPFHLLSGRRLYNLPDELCFHQIEEEFRELITGRDGQIRGAVVDTVLRGRSSILKRPVQKLFPLEVNQNEGETDPLEDTTNYQEEITIDGSNNHRENISKPEFESLNTTAEPQSGISTRPKRSAALEARDKIFARLCED